MIFNAIKLGIISMILLHIYYIYTLIVIDIKEECLSDALEISYCLLFEMVILLLLLFRMFIGVFTRNSTEINWDNHLFEIVDNNSNKYNIMTTFYLIQIMFACVGILSIKCIWNYLTYVDDKCIILNQYIGFGFVSFFLVSIYNYCKLIVVVCFSIATIIVPEKMFYYFDRLLEKKSKINTKLFIGNVPECCVCYEENCWINRCGHLICKKCALQIKNLKCPLCQGNLDLVQTYQTYKKNHSTQY